MDDTTPTTEAPPRLVAFRSGAGETLVLTNASIATLRNGGDVSIRGWPSAGESKYPSAHPRVVVSDRVSLVSRFEDHRLELHFPDNVEEERALFRALSETSAAAWLRWREGVVSCPSK